MNKKTLILGGTGKTGARIVSRLSALNIPVVAGSRNGSPAFDWEDEATWPQVLHDINKVYITYQPDLAVPAAYQKIGAFVEAAKRSGVTQLVLLSGRGEPEAQRCEDLVLQSGLTATVIRSSWFMQNFSESFLLDGILNNDVVLPQIATKEPFIDIDDIADMAVEILQSDAHAGKVYEVTGPELLGFETAVQEIGKRTGRAISYQEIPVKAYLEALQEHSLPADYVALLRYLFTEVLDGRNASITNDVKKVLGREAGSFEAYVHKTVAAGAWQKAHGQQPL